MARWGGGLVIKYAHLAFLTWVPFGSYSVPIPSSVEVILFSLSCPKEFLSCHLRGLYSVPLLYSV